MRDNAFIYFYSLCSYLTGGSILVEGILQAFLTHIIFLLSCHIFHQRSSINRCKLDDAAHLVLDHEINGAHQQLTSSDIQVTLYTEYKVCARVRACV